MPHAVQRLIDFRDKYIDKGDGWAYAFRTWNVSLAHGTACLSGVPSPKGLFLGWGLRSACRAMGCVGAVRHVDFHSQGPLRCLFPTVPNAGEQQRQRLRSLWKGVVGGRLQRGGRGSMGVSRRPLQVAAAEEPGSEARLFKSSSQVPHPLLHRTGITSPAAAPTPCSVSCCVGPGHLEATPRVPATTWSQHACRTRPVQGTHAVRVPPFPPAGEDRVPGDGYVTNIHFSLTGAEGTPPKEVCGFVHAKEWDFKVRGPRGWVGNGGVCSLRR